MILNKMLMTIAGYFMTALFQTNKKLARSMDCRLGFDYEISEKNLFLAQFIYKLK